MCRGCGAYPQPRNGKGDAYAYCKVCHPGAIQAYLAKEIGDIHAENMDTDMDTLVSRIVVRGGSLGTAMTPPA